MQPIDETRDLGFMLYDMNFEDPDNPTPQSLPGVYGERSREYRSQGSGGERMILQALKEYS